MPSAPDCEKNPTRPEPGRSGARVALSRTSGAVLATPSALGPITRIPWARASATSRRSATVPLPPASANPDADHHERLHALREAGVHDLVDARGRDGDHGEVDLVGDVGDRGVGPHSAHRPGLGVDRVDRAGEVGAQQVRQHGVADLGRVGGRPDHRDRRRMQHVVHAARLGPLLAGVADGERALGGVDVELQVQHALGERPAHLVAGIAEDPHHLVVLHQHLGLEPAHTVLAGGRGEVLQQDRAEPAALVLVADDEGHLRRLHRLRRARASRPSYRPTAMISSPSRQMNATRVWWSTVVKRTRSRGEMRGYGPKNRR